MRVCFHCEEEIKNDEPRFMCGLDKPYINLWFHRSCISQAGVTTEYVIEKSERLEKFVEESRKNGKK
jgi:hypothetical protein